MASSDPSGKTAGKTIGAPQRLTGATRPGVVVGTDDDGTDLSRSAPRRPTAASANSQPVPTQAADPDCGRSKKPNSGPTAIPTTLSQRRSR